MGRARRAWRDGFGRGLAKGAAIAAVATAVAITAGTSVAAPRARAAAGACATSGLVVWLANAPGGGTAGSTYYTLNLTNLSGTACTLNGYPGVSAVDLAGRQVGAAASRDHAYAPHSVTIANGHTASATLRIVDSGNFPSASCQPVTAAGLRVYPPNQTASKLVPFPFGACAGAADGVLMVRAIR